jgi:hypothetical protein
MPADSVLSRPSGLPGVGVGGCVRGRRGALGQQRASLRRRPADSALSRPSGLPGGGERAGWRESGAHARGAASAKVGCGSRANARGRRRETPRAPMAKTLWPTARRLDTPTCAQAARQRAARAGHGAAGARRAPGTTSPPPQGQPQPHPAPAALPPPPARASIGTRSSCGASIRSTARSLPGSAPRSCAMNFLPLWRVTWGRWGDGRRAAVRFYSWGLGVGRCRVGGQGWEWVTGADCARPGPRGPTCAWLAPWMTWKLVQMWPGAEGRVEGSGGVRRARGGLSLVRPGAGLGALLGAGTSRCNTHQAVGAPRCPPLSPAVPPLPPRRTLLVPHEARAHAHLRHGVERQRAAARRCERRDMHHAWLAAVGGLG